MCSRPVVWSYRLANGEVATVFSTLPTSLLSSLIGWDLTLFAQCVRVVNIFTRVA